MRFAEPDRWPSDHPDWVQPVWQTKTQKVFKLRFQFTQVSAAFESPSPASSHRITTLRLIAIKLIGWSPLLQAVTGCYKLPQASISRLFTGIQLQSSSCRLPSAFQLRSSAFEVPRIIWRQWPCSSLEHPVFKALTLKQTLAFLCNELQYNGL